jgi:hypothetical protein
LAFPTAQRGEAPGIVEGGTEALAADAEVRLTANITAFHSESAVPKKREPVNAK